MINAYLENEQAHTLLDQLNVDAFDKNVNLLSLTERIKILAEQIHINSEINANIVSGTITGVVIENLGQQL